jgi:hypothetical protein
VLQCLLVIKHLTCKDETLILWQQPYSSSSSSSSNGGNDGNSSKG